MDLFSEEIIIVLALFGRGELDPIQLREYLAKRFFSDNQERPFDHLLIGEVEAALAEYEKGDIELEDLRNVTIVLKNNVLFLLQQLNVLNQEPVLALV